MPGKRAGEGAKKANKSNERDIHQSAIAQGKMSAGTEHLDGMLEFNFELHQHFDGCLLAYTAFRQSAVKRQRTESVSVVISPSQHGDEAISVKLVVSDPHAAPPKTTAVQPTAAQQQPCNTQDDTGKQQQHAVVVEFAELLAGDGDVETIVLDGPDTADSSKQADSKKGKKQVVSDETAKGWSDSFTWFQLLPGAASASGHRKGICTWCQQHDSKHSTNFAKKQGAVVTDAHELKTHEKTDG
jgi:hypothetical protein